MEKPIKNIDIDKQEFINSYATTKTYLTTSLLLTKDTMFDIDGLVSEIDGVTYGLSRLRSSESDEKYIREYSGYLDEIEGRIKPKLREMRSGLDDIYDDLSTILLRLEERFKERLSQIL
ncbi:MAG: hypothetical protein QXL14_02630 [Candidatus Aenigmatarchaeota archaeon]